MITLDGIIFSLQKDGGISTYFKEISNRLLSAGISGELLLFDGAGADRFSYPSVRRCSSRGVERYRSCLLPADTELFHSSYYRVPDNGEIPVITTVHDFTYELFNSGLRRSVHTWQKNKAIRRAASIICVSENTKNDLLNLVDGIDPERIHVIYNGVGSAFFPLNSGELSRSRPYILYVGSRVYYKNFTAVADAMRHLPEFELVCVGGGPFTRDELRYLETAAKGRYCHKGSVTEHDLNSLYNGAVCLMYPSLYEGFGIPVVEAMRAGCPVVALDRSSIPEVAGEAALLLPCADPLLLSAAAERLARKDERQLFRQKGFVQAASFSWDTTFSKTLEVYEKTLGRSLVCEPKG